MGHDAVHLTELGLDRLPDDAIPNLAREQGRIVLTFDLDFGDLLAAGVHETPSVVIFRLSNATPAFVTPRISELIEAWHDELQGGAIAIVEDTRYRIRRLPIA